METPGQCVKQSVTNQCKTDVEDGNTQPVFACSKPTWKHQDNM